MIKQYIADLLHVGQRTYSDYESGKTRIPVDSLIILAQYYNVSMDYISGVSNKKRQFPAAENKNPKINVSDSNN